MQDSKIRKTTKRAKPVRKFTQKGGARTADPWIDPYLLWNLGTEFRAFPTMAPWYPVALELRTSAMDFAASVRESPVLRKWIRVAAPYAAPIAGLEKSRFCTAFIHREAMVNQAALSDLASKSGTSVVSLQLGFPREVAASRMGFDELAFEGMPDAASLMFSMVEPGAPPAVPAPAVASPVFVGIIDDGIAFANQRFRMLDADGKATASRVEFFWDQGAAIDLARPVKYGYGRAMDKREIDERFKASTFAGTVEEDDLYRRAGYTMLEANGATLMRCCGHGTHVLDLAAGEFPSRCTSSTPGIIAVQLPDRTARDTSGASLVSNALDGIRYILDCVAQLTIERGLQRPSVIINLSYGFIAGPHDGTSVLEAAIDEIVRDYNADLLVGKLAIVLPAGNHRQSRCHASVQVKPTIPNAPDTPATLQWRIQPDDATPSFMEIWLPRDLPAAALDDIDIVVRAPSGLEGGAVGFNSAMSMVWARSADGTLDTDAKVEKGKDSIFFQLSFVRSFGNSPMFLLAMAPTISLEGNPTAESGIWSIVIRNRSAKPLAIEAWIQRDDSLIGRPKLGRQSRFADPNYQRYDPMGRLNEIDDPGAYCKRAGTLNGLATGKLPVVVGGFDRDRRRAADYSGTGPCRQPFTGDPRKGSDVIATSDTSAVLHGVRGAGTRSGTVFWMNGTSVAAPLVTRWLAQRLVTIGPPAQSMRRLVAKDAPRLAARPPIPGQAAKPEGNAPGKSRPPLIDLPSPRHHPSERNP